MDNQKKADGICSPIRIQELWRDLRISKNREEHMSILYHEEDLIQARVVPDKKVMAALILALKEAKIRA